MSAGRTQAAILARRDRRTPRLQPNRVVQYSTAHGDCVDFMQIQPDTVEDPETSAWLEGFSARDKVVLALIKFFDSLLSLYVAGLLIYVIQLTWTQLGPGAGAEVTVRSPASVGLLNINLSASPHLSSHSDGGDK